MCSFRLQPGQGFAEKMKSTKGGVEEEDDDEEEELLKKEECSSQRGEFDFLWLLEFWLVCLRFLIFFCCCVVASAPAVDGGGGKGDAKGVDQKAATPRSKHSATEQRRRSKINDR